MTREEAKTMLPIIQAYAEGKEIEIFDKTTKMWKTAMLPHFDCDSKIYRIKPGVNYRPFANEEECWQEMQKHQPFGWVKTKDKGIRLCMSGLNQKSAFTQVGHEYDEAFDEFIFADGFPFGVKVEE